MAEIQHIRETRTSKTQDHVGVGKWEALTDVRRSVRNELRQSIESDQWGRSQKLIWKEGIQNAQKFFWIIPLDGKYTEELFQKIIDFQKLNGLSPDGVIWPETLLMIENKEYFNVIPWAENINEMFEEIIESIIHTYIEKLDTPEWINLSWENMYFDLISILRDTWKHLKQGNIFWWDIELLIKYFLEPKEKWIHLVQIILNTVLQIQGPQSSQEKIMNEGNLDTVFDFTKSLFNFLFDACKSKTPEQIQWQIHEFMNVKEIKGVFERFPDLERFLSEVFPKILNHTDRKLFWQSFDAFYTSVKSDLLVYLNGTGSQEQIKTIHLHILNQFSNFLQTIVNEEQVDILLSELLDFRFVKDNDTSSSLLSLINEADISRKEKLKLTRKIISWLGLVSKSELTDTDINMYIGEFSLLIKDLSWKIPDEKLKKVIRKFYWWDSQWTWNLSVDVLESLRVLFQSKNALDVTLWISREVIWQYAQDAAKKVGGYLEEVKSFWSHALGFSQQETSSSSVQDQTEQVSANESFEDFILSTIRSWKIDGTIADLWGKVVETLKKVVWIDLRTTIQKVRESFMSEDFFKQIQDSKPEKKLQLSKIESNFVAWLIDSISTDAKALILEKIQHPQNNNLTKDEIITLVLSHIPTYMSEHTDLISNYLKELWISWVTKENMQGIERVIVGIVNHPQTKLIISEIISNIWKELKWDNIPQKMKSIIKQSIQTHWESLMTPRTQWTVKDVAVDTFYEQILSDHANLTEVRDVLATKIPLKLDLDSQDLSNVANVFKKYVPKDAVRHLLDTYGEILNGKINKGMMRTLVAELYSQIEDKPWFIREVSSTWLLEKWTKAILSQQKTEQKSDWRNMDLWIDLLYTTIETSNETELSDSLDSLLKQYGLSEFANISVFWEKLSSSMVTVLKSIDKDDLKDFIHEFQYDFKKLIQGKLSWSEKMYLYSLLWTELMKRVQIEKFQRECQKCNLSPSERLFVYYMPEIQKFVSENWSTLASLLQQWKDVYNISTWRIDLRKVSPESIKSYGRRLFDCIHSFILTLEPKAFSALAGSSKTLSWEQQRMLKAFKDAFEVNNLLFLSQEVLSWVLSWFQFNVWESMYDYFYTSANRDNFWNTLYDFLTNMHPKQGWNPEG